jgi:hypothetical protein
MFQASTSGFDTMSLLPRQATQAAALRDMFKDSGLHHHGRNQYCSYSNLQWMEVLIGKTL